MTEYRIVSFMQPAGILGTVPGGVAVQTVDILGSVPQLADYVDGWEVINAQIVPAGEAVYIVLFLKTSVSVDDASSLG